MYYASITTDDGRITVHGLPTMHDALRAGEQLQDEAYARGAKTVRGTVVYPTVTIGSETESGSQLTETTAPIIQ